MQQVRAKKFLGQHFLKDLSIAQRISETITSGPTIEIGPGMGVLTQYLLKNPNIQLTAIEIDRESVVYLKECYPELHLIEGDFLKLDLNIIYPEGEFNHRQLSIQYIQPDFLQSFGIQRPYSCMFGYDPKRGSRTDCF